MRINYSINKEQTAFHLSLFSLTLLYVWIGLFKFTQVEANAIVEIVKNSPFMGWLYSFLSVQQVSNTIGVAEVIIALFLIGGHFNYRMALVGSTLSILTMLVTLSFLFSTPGVWSKVENFWITDFFILKDVWGMALSFQIFVTSYNAIKKAE